MLKVISSVYPLDSALDSKVSLNVLEVPEEIWRSDAGPFQPELIVKGGVRSPLHIFLAWNLTSSRSGEPGTDRSI